MKARYLSPALIARLLFAIGIGLLFTQSTALAGPKAKAGPYRIELVTEPAVIPPIGKATLQVTLTDASGKPIEGATLRAMTKMPGMNMGEREQSSVPRKDQPGVYDIPAQFAMEGGYESTVQISGPLGAATARIPLATGQNTAETGGGNRSVLPLLLWGGAGLAFLCFVLYRVKKTGQKVEWKGVFNRQVLGGLLLLIVIAAGSWYAVKNLRRPGALTPVEAQAMDMSYLPAPPGHAPVELAVATRGAVESNLRYTGTAVGYLEQEVYPRITGTLVYMPLYVSDRVTKGQVIARLDTSQTEPQLAQQRAMASMAREGIGVARAERTEAEAEVEQAHAERAGKQGALSEAKAQVQAAEEEKSAAEAALTSGRAKIEDVEAAVVSAKANQTYWQAQIKRSATLKDAGAISGEEYQRDRAQAEAADAAVKQAEASVSQARADLSGAEAAKRKAASQIAAATARVRMAESEFAAQNAYIRAARAAVKTADRKIAQAQSGAVQAEAGVQAAQASRGYAEIRAETDGVVTRRLISPGVLVGPGQAILTIARINPIRLQANVAEADLARVRIGGWVEVRGRDEAAKPVRARITTVSPAVDPGSRTAVVEALVPNPNRRFLPGQYVVMDIATGTQQAVLHVPTRAVQYRTPDTEGVQTTVSQPFVWLAEASGQEGQYAVRRVDVTLGARGEDKTEVVSGLSEGQQVVVSGGAYLKNGDAVAQVRKQETGGEADAGATASGGTAGSEGDVQTASVKVNSQGYEPASVSLKAGSPVRITFTRITDATCGTEVLFPEYGINKPLPLNQAVVVEFTPRKAGEISFTCGMKMFQGKVVVR